MSQQDKDDSLEESQLIGRFSNTVDFNSQSLKQFVPLTRQQKNRQTFGSKPNNKYSSDTKIKKDKLIKDSEIGQEKLRKSVGKSLNSRQAQLLDSKQQYTPKAGNKTDRTPIQRFEDDN